MYPVISGSNWPSRSAAIARSTRGCALPGPGPISSRWGGSISPKSLESSMISGAAKAPSFESAREPLDEADHYVERDLGIDRVNGFGGIVADAALAADEQHRGRAQRGHADRIVPGARDQPPHRLPGGD